MDKITIIMKVTNSCNLHCKHCYEKNSNLNLDNNIMSRNVLESTIEKVQKEYKNVTYIWFGGEPLLADITFFKDALNFQNRYGQNCTIQNRIQTNGTLFSDDIILFLKENKFSVSISFDGLYNNILRQNTEKVLQGIQKCKKLGLQVNALTTVCSLTSSKQIENYNFFKREKIPVKFNPIFPAGAANDNQEYLLNESQYLKNTKCFFDYWLFDAEAIPVSSFVQYVKMFLNYPGRNCVYNACLFKVINIEPDGTVFPCSRYFKKEYNIGNILNVSSISNLFQSNNFKTIVEKSILRRKQCMSFCQLYKYCLGGCSSACANECGLEQHNTQLCRITQEILPYVFSQLSKICKTEEIINPIVLYLYNLK